MDINFKTGFEKVASGYMGMVNKAIKTVNPTKNMQKIQKNIKWTKPKTPKTMGGIFGPKSFN